MSMTDDLLGTSQATTLARILGAAHAGQLGSGGVAIAASAAAPEMSAAAQSLTGLGLSERARALAGAIEIDFGSDPVRIAALTRDALADDEFTGWMLWPAGLAVARTAVARDDVHAFDEALAVLRELTPRMTSEFAIRPLLLHDLDRALPQLLEWTQHDDWNVRRLASEGSRPLLPWAERIPALVADPVRSRAILDALYDDPEESVRRSVANHLNDHSRAHAAHVVEAVTGWRTSGGAHVERTARHALRTLVKRGDVGALTFLGFGAVNISVAPLVLTSEQVPLGGEIGFAGELTNVGDAVAHVIVDYVLGFPDARGGERRKVFKLVQRELAPGESVTVSGTQSFRPLTTRRYYPGVAWVALQVNGVVQDRAAFELVDSDGAVRS
ncbi:DNA alkylation repair protein [Leucobacter japonicus]|uniref:DNA alkylation repair protein n=1 Tax=Leucobacter japonicus TaxID=1461259 RepID=UPI0006A7785C|nr:hypothetical protein [Leucobacter japonicus]